MELEAVVRRRRMVRNFTDEPVDPAVVARILDLARHAPSAGFTQGQAFVVVTNPATRKAVADLCGEASYVAGGFDPWISRAPVLVVPCTSEAAYHRRYQEPDKLQGDGSEIAWPVPYWHMDIGCAVMVLLLAVVDAGLAAGFAGCWDLDVLRALLGIPAEVTPILADAVRRARAGGALPFIVGGDCLISLGAVGGLDGAAPGVVWIDAHGDFNTPETTPSGYLGGMPLAALAGRCLPALATAAGLQTPIPEECIVLLGARDLDPPEQAALAASQVTVLTSEQVRAGGEALQRALARLGGQAPVYLHL